MNIRYLSGPALQSPSLVCPQHPRKLRRSSRLDADCVVLHLGVEPDDHTPDRLVVLVDEELEEEEIHDGGTKDTSPESRMRPGERSVGEGEDGDDEEEDRDPDQPTVDVAVNVSCLVPGDACLFYHKTTR